jgi:hypothetical protein
MQFPFQYAFSTVRLTASAVAWPETTPFAAPIAPPPTLPTGPPTEAPIAAPATAPPAAPVRVPTACRLASCFGSWFFAISLHLHAAWRRTANTRSILFRRLRGDGRRHVLANRLHEGPGRDRHRAVRVHLDPFPVVSLPAD